ncbi:response regulator transcription factor [Paenibacillus sp.]|uniref:response regulator transcription factor n=1 Tax=Paenibacillus sp. TaxID=58172 RepID=UPI002D668639|nr:response regulator [Paenibacillus sp.]HZG57034.1 response regulator [Paenibacillus sp.]
MAFTVLTVDDEIMIKRTVRKLLEGSDTFRWIGDAEDGAEALEFVERMRPDVVVTDITMPVMDGLELIRRLKEAPRRPEIVILSGYDDFPFVQEAIRQGVADYLLKPIKPPEFQATMERIAARLRETRRVEPARTDWLPLSEAAGRRLADAAWMLQPEAAAEALGEVMSWTAPRFGDAPAAGVWIDVLHFVSGELRQRGGIELDPDGVGMLERARSASEAKDAAARAIEEAMERIRQSRNWGNHRQLRAAIEVVDASFPDPNLSMQALAEKFSMSPAYFSRSFKAETGQTFVQYVTGLRMERARELLADAALTTTEAARASGFADYPHFAKAFKRQYGLSPSEYRKRMGVARA